MKVTLETFVNPDVVEFHCKRRVVNAMGHHFRAKNWLSLYNADRGGLLRFLSLLFGGRAAWRYDAEEQMEIESHTPMLTELFAVSGVVEVSLHQYSIQVTKGRMFDWQELEPIIIAILGSYLG